MSTPTAEFWKNAYDSGTNDLDPGLWESTLNDGFVKSFSAFHNKVAMAFMGVEITFAELEKYSNRFANMLLAQGLTKGDVVGIDLANIPEYIIAYIGTLKAGCVVSGVSPLLSPDEIKFQLADSDAKAFVTLDAIFEKHLTKIHANLPKLKVVIAASIGGFLPGIKSFLGKMLGKIPSGKVTPLDGKNVLMFHDVLCKGLYSDAAPDVTLAPDDIAYLQYTGGTTGTPKGAMLTHRNALADIHIVMNWLHLENGGSVAISAFPLFHIAGLFTSSCFLYYGITQVLIPNPRNTDHICEEMKKYKPFATANVPSLYHLLMSNPKFSKLDHSALKICISAAASFPEDSQKKLEDIIGSGKLIEAYGMTETSPLTVMNPTWGEKKLGHIGLPLPNTKIKLLDPLTGREVPCGVPGEMCIKGPVVMAGYYKQPEETAMAVDSDGFMHTGDIAVQDEAGYLKIVDRTKDMVNVSGYKVFSKKIEDILTEHPAVGEIAIIGIPDIDRPGSELVAALVKVQDGYRYDGDEKSLKENMVSFARERLATYEIPKIIEFRKELPLTSVGKLDKKKLREDFRHSP